MPSQSQYWSPTSPTHVRFRDHSPTKSSPLRTVSTRSNDSDTENRYHHGHVAGRSGVHAFEPTPITPIRELPSSPAAKRGRSESPVKQNAAFAKWEQREQQAEQDQNALSTRSPKRTSVVDAHSPTRLKDNGWPQNSTGRGDARPALGTVASNVAHERATDARGLAHRPRSSGSDHRQVQRPSSRDGIATDLTPHRSHSRTRSEGDRVLSPGGSAITSPPSGGHASKNSMATLSRSDSLRGSPVGHKRGHARFNSVDSPQLEPEDLAKLQKSSTPQLQYLGQMSNDGAEDFTIHSAEEQVTGLFGRRRLQRAESGQDTSKHQSKFASQYASTRWMDTQRKHLQAYEYLCHIGEARNWLQDALDGVELPPIVQLEEALRNGVTLAEVVVKLARRLTHSQQSALGSQRIFTSSKLQYRHSDNIALFFRFLAQVELPELFRFELVDLYEKKNVPKVIYCIHALAWLLFRQGLVDFRIGNLLGQLHFEEHELEETQKGIDKSGIPMPNFGGMKQAMQIEEPEPEPEPTPEEILAGEREVIEDLQAQARGALVRLRLGGVMQELWDVEDKIAALQAVARGGFAREVFDFKFTMDKSTRKLQAAGKGFLQRQSLRKREQSWKENGTAVIKVQALFRGRQQRLATQKIKTQIFKEQNGLKAFQALARGSLSRWRAGDVWHETRQQESLVLALQAFARGSLERRRVQSERSLLEDASSQHILLMQAMLRGKQVRQRNQQLRLDLIANTGSIIQLQSLSRAMIERLRIGSQLAALEMQEVTITSLQSMARAFLERQRIFDLLVAFEEHDVQTRELQALARAMMCRSRIGSLLATLENHEDDFVQLQAHCRAALVRRKFEEKRKHYHENMQKVIKLQSFVRARQQGESYKSLVNGKNPPLPVVRRHLHLLTDSTLEFESELESDRLRRQVVESVRRNELVESYIEGLDVKIALLVKNKITLDEVVKHQKHFGGSAGQLLRNGSTIGHTAGGFDLKALNKSARKKLGGYEELFFILQTQPGYLARLINLMSNRGMTEKDGKSFERLITTLFGYAQQQREEYYLLKLLSTSMQHSLIAAHNIDEFQRQQSSAYYHRLLLNTLRSPRDRAYLKTLMGDMVKQGICGQDHLDLESDPLQIYRAVLNNEELSTGRTSSRPRDLPREVVIREPDVRPKYVEHLQALRDLCDSFLLSMEETLHRMPYGIRFMASEQLRILCDRFPHDDPQQFAVFSGNYIWRSYVLPALREPEIWGVVDRGLSPSHKRNLGQVVTVLSQVAMGRLFGAEHLYLQPLNSWVTEALERWQECLHRIFALPLPEDHYDADQFSDLYATTKPTLYIKLADIFALHNVLTDNLSVVAPARDDHIRELLADLGSAKSNESDLSGAARGSEITLTLKSRFTVKEDPNAEARALFTATKRLILYVIKVQSGTNLMEILLRPISHEDADKWVQVVQEEVYEVDRGQQKRAGHRRNNSSWDAKASLRGAKQGSTYSEAFSTTSDDRKDLLDLQSMTYAELKSTALENILRLEQPAVPPQFRVTRSNNYQEVLNALASDIRQKHRRRLERQQELETTRATLSQLDSKAAFLEDQLKSYNDYIEQCLHTLASKKGSKHKFILPFTKQWSHVRELERSGRQPRFGSYKYSARQLFEKGVLLSWKGYSPEHFSQLNIIIASDEVGVFHLEASAGSMMLPGCAANLLLDDLLQAQYDGRETIEVFDEASGMSQVGGRGDGAVKLGVNLLLHLVFKKFYRDQ